MFMTKHLLALVALAVGAAASCDVCSDELYDGKCGALSQEAEDKWDDWMVEGLEIAGCIEDVCCASNEDDCCEANVGAIVGIVIALVVVIGGSVRAPVAGLPPEQGRRGNRDDRSRPAAPPTHPRAVPSQAPALLHGALVDLTLSSTSA